MNTVQLDKSQKPEVLAPDGTGMPAELKNLDRWVVWKMEYDEGKNRWTKVPYQTNGRRAKSNDPKTWASFGEACGAYVAGDYDGVELALTKEDTLVGLDYDHVRNPETGEILPQDYDEVMSLKTYAEISPSGSGIRVFLIANKEDLPSGRKMGKYELYSSGHFLTVTGRFLEGCPRTIEDRSAEARMFIEKHSAKDAPKPPSNALPPALTKEDEELLAKARTSRNGDKFKALYDAGEWKTAGYPSQSEADLALCNQLAFWTSKDRVRMDALFRWSKLMRLKWDEQHASDGSTYGAFTLDKAIASTKEVYKAGPASQPGLITDIHPPLQVLPAWEFIELELPPREHILSPWINASALVMVHGPRGIGKTRFAMGVACGVASGRGFLNWKVPKPRGVLYIDGELPAEELKLIMLETLCDPRYDHLGDLPLKILAYDFQQQGIPSLSGAVGQALIEPHLDGVDLIIIDSISTLTDCAPENEAESWVDMQRWLLSLRQRGYTVYLNHHSGKSGLQRGTSKREDVLDTVIKLVRPSDYKPEQGARFEIHFDKARRVFGPDAAPLEAWLKKDQDGHPIWTSDTMENVLDEQILKLNKEGKSLKEIGDVIERSKSTVCRRLNRLLKGDAKL
jgi:hypothetical protein